MTVIEVYTDGSCINNNITKDEKNNNVISKPKAGIGVYFGPNDKRNFSGPLKGLIQTNQRAELMAAIKALEIVNYEDDIKIITDSKYLKLAMTQWIFNWKKNGWKTSSGKTVKNKDLFKRLVELEELKKNKGGNVYWSWVKGHSTSQGNNCADLLARKGAMLQ